MPLKILPYPDLDTLICRHISKEEDPGTAELMERLSEVRKRGYFTRPDLIEICHWKSPRAIRYIYRNRAERVQKIAAAAFATRSEQRKLSLLTSLHGIGVPMASAILTITNPRRYGVIDIRAWQLLYTMQAVHTNAKGMGFSYKQWDNFLNILRYYAKKYRVSARDIERTFFEAHKFYQKGRLYK